MDEVAKAAGVSQATVSRVVNGNPRVNLRRAARSSGPIERLGFRAQQRRTDARHAGSDSIGVLIPERPPGLRRSVLRPGPPRRELRPQARRQKLVLFLPQTDDRRRRSSRAISGPATSTA